LLTLGLEKDLSTPSSSSLTSNVAPVFEEPLSAWGMSGCFGLC